MKYMRLVILLFYVMLIFNMMPVFAAEQKAVPFEVGEQLVFDVYFSLLKVGEATMTIKGIVEIDGRKAYHIVLLNRTTPGYSKIFRVDDRLETFLDTEKMLPLKYVKCLQEGDYSCSETTVFDHQNLVANFESHSRPRKLSFPIKPKTQDTLSLFYAIRLMEIEIGKPLMFDIMSDEKVYQLKIKPHRRIRKPIYGGDTYDTIQLIPRAKYKGDLFAKGRGWLWVTDDDRKLPVCFRASLPFGSITFALVKIRNIYQDNSAEENSDAADTETGQLQGEEETFFDKKVFSSPCTPIPFQKLLAGYFVSLLPEADCGRIPLQAGLNIATHN